MGSSDWLPCRPSLNRNGLGCDNINFIVDFHLTVLINKQKGNFFLRLLVTNWIVFAYRVVEVDFHKHFWRLSQDFDHVNILAYSRLCNSFYGPNALQIIPWMGIYVLQQDVRMIHIKHSLYVNPGLVLFLFEEIKFR